MIIYYQAIRMWQKRGISNKQMMVIGAIMDECLDKCEGILKETTKEVKCLEFT